MPPAGAAPGAGKGAGPEPGTRAAAAAATAAAAGSSGLGGRSSGGALIARVSPKVWQMWDAATLPAAAERKQQTFRESRRAAGGRRGREPERRRWPSGARAERSGRAGRRARGRAGGRRPAPAAAARSAPGTAAGPRGRRRRGGAGRGRRRRADKGNRSPPGGEPPPVRSSRSGPLCSPERRTRPFGAVLATSCQRSHTTHFHQPGDFGCTPERQARSPLSWDFF